MFKLNLKLPQLLSGAKRKRKQVKVKEPKKAVNFYFGEQDQMDLISYSGLKEENTYLQIGDRYIRTMFISGYPYVASTGWLSMLINFNHNIDITYHIEQVDPLLALPKLNRKITELESTKRNMVKDGKVVGSEITDPLESAMELKDKILRGQEKLFQISIYMTITTHSLADLQKLTTLLETVMSTKLFYIKNATIFFAFGFPRVNQFSQ